MNKQTYGATPAHLYVGQRPVNEPPKVVEADIKPSANAELDRIKEFVPENVPLVAKEVPEKLPVEKVKISWEVPDEK